MDWCPQVLTNVATLLVFLCSLKVALFIHAGRWYRTVLNLPTTTQVFEWLELCL